MSNFKQFSTMPVSDQLRQAIAEMGFTEPTPIQELVLPHGLKKRDILGQAQTGTGKTLAFSLPIIELIDQTAKYVQAIVLTPTRELARQVTAEMEKLAVGSQLQLLTIYGGASMDKQINALKRGAQVVIGTPGRVCDLIRQKKLKLDKVSMAVLDEVDEMLDMGFYDEVRTVFAKIPKERQTMFFSATIPPRIQKLGRTYLKRPVILSTSDEKVMADNNEHLFYEVKDRERLNALCDIVDYEQVELGLVFSRTKIEADRIYRELRKRGYSVEALHGDLPQSKREQVMKKYRSGKLELLIATNVAARGIDVQGVTHVINYHIPLDAEVYVHRTGRTGRAGASGKSITFVSSSEYYDLVKIQEANDLHIKNCTLPDKNELFTRRMEKMLDKLKKELATADIKETYKIVKKKIPFFWRGKALAFLVKKYTEAGYSFMDAGTAASASAGDTVRLFINLGKNHGIDIRSMKDLFIKNGGVTAADLQKIDILERYSFVNVAKGKESSVIKKLSTSKFKTYKINVEVSRGKSSSGSGGRDGRPRSGGYRSGGSNRPRNPRRK